MRALAERERAQDSIRDTVVNGLYSVGLTLHVLLQHELTQASEERIWIAIDELDESIVAARDAIFPVRSPLGAAVRMPAVLVTQDPR